MVTLFLAALLTSESAVVSALTHKFVAAVEARDVVALHELIGRETDFSRSDWWSLRELMEKFDHILCRAIGAWSSKEKAIAGESGRR